MEDGQKIRVKEYISILNTQVEPGMLLDLILDTVIDRVLLYLNETTVATNLERVIAQLTVTAYQKAVADSTTTGISQAISSVTDGNQTVSFKESALMYMNTASDQELFTGFVPLLNRYRRIGVISSETADAVTS